MERMFILRNPFGEKRQSCIIRHYLLRYEVQHFTIDNIIGYVVYNIIYDFTIDEACYLPLVRHILHAKTYRYQRS